MNSPLTDKIIVICGPTATGKTSLGISLGKKFAGEIVSIDSRQIYKGLEIGTGKQIRDTRYEIRNTAEGHWDIEDKETGDGLRIHLYDLIDPDEDLNAVQYARVAVDRVKKIWSREKLPFLVGGAGLYLEILLGKVEVAKVPPNEDLRAELEEYTTEELFERLRKLDPQRAKSIDPHSPHRLIRAIEIAESEDSKKGKDASVEILPSKLDPLWIGLNAPRSFLYQKADQRLEKMVENGLIDEIASVVEKYGWEIPALDSIGYIEFKAYFGGEKSLEECLERAQYNTHAYIRRQLTWFRRNEKINWFDITEANFDQKVEQLVESYIERGT
ncbi:MAG: tRNA (adenosine(37)-N6)-dimethylallyltransferase MiaA [Patescibacteria group bacterium]